MQSKLYLLPTTKFNIFIMVEFDKGLMGCGSTSSTLAKVIRSTSEGTSESNSCINSKSVHALMVVMGRACKRKIRSPTIAHSTSRADPKSDSKCNPILANRRAVASDIDIFIVSCLLRVHLVTTSSFSDNFCPLLPTNEALITRVLSNFL